MTPPVLTSDAAPVVKAAIEKHGPHADALIPILSEINAHFGYIPANALHEVSKQLNMPSERMFVHESSLFGIASFYHMFSTQPRGRHVITFCESAPCHVMGGRALFQAIEDRLGIGAGQTTPDDKWSFVKTSCLGTCGVGPVLLVDGDLYGNVRPEDLNTIFARYA